ncbi:MAG: conjugal transfer protein TraH [Geovibrio sp.]|nr:conjugal transfer protein TraH [Geovibrio sp.]
MKKTIALLLTLTYLTVTTAPAYAGLSDDMHGFLDDLGVMSNITTPGSFEAGGRQVFSGGSLSMRFNNNIPPIATFQPPSLRVSCSGMDFNAGLVSILGLDVIQNLLSQGGTTLAWGLLIGLSYSLPTVANVFEKIQKYVRLMQELSGNLCQIGTRLGQAIGDELWGKAQEEKKGQDVASGSTSTFETALKTLFDNPGELVKKQRGNIVYDTIANIPGLPLNEETKETMMALFGTIEWHPSTDTSGDCNPSSTEVSEATASISTYVPRADSIDTLNKLINGGKITGYSCGAKCAAAGIINTTCLDLSNKEITVTGIKNDVQTALIKAVDRLVLGYPIDTDDVKYLEIAAVPNITDTIMYLAIQKKMGMPVLKDIEILSTYYGYSLLEYIMSYLWDTVTYGVPEFQKHKSPTLEVHNAITEWLANFKGSQSSLNARFYQAKMNFIKELEVFNKEFELGKMKATESGYFLTSGSFSNSLSGAGQR